MTRAFIADIYADAGAGQQAVLEAIRGVNRQVISNEPNASVYYWYIPEDPSDGTVYGLEDYATITDHVDVHNTSSAFVNLVDVVGKSCSGDPKLSLEYLSQVVGFTQRDEPKKAGLVHVERFVTDPSSQDATIDIFRELAASVEKSEPQTLSFVVYHGAEKPGQIVVFERFESRSGLNAQPTHRQKAEGDLRPYIKTKTAHSYREAGIGFMKRL